MPARAFSASRPTGGILSKSCSRSEQPSVDGRSRRDFTMLSGECEGSRVRPSREQKCLRRIHGNKVVRFLHRSRPFPRLTGRARGIDLTLTVLSPRPTYRSVAATLSTYTSAPCHPVARAECCVYLPDEGRASRAWRGSQVLSPGAAPAPSRSRFGRADSHVVRAPGRADDERELECVVVLPLLTRVADDVAVVMTPGSDSAP
jgi:hypothetical protein